MEAEALLALAQRLGQFVAFQLPALALVDVAGVGADAGRRRVDALLAPSARGGGDELDDARLAQLHGVPVEPPHLVLVQVRIDVPQDLAEQIGGRPVGEPSPGFVHVDETILPVEGHEALVDLLEHGQPSGLEVTPRAGRLRPGELAGGTPGLRGLGERVSFDHVHLEAAVQMQAHLVHEPVDQVQAAAAGGERVGRCVRVEGVEVEAGTPVLHAHDQITLVEARRDLEVVAAPAVAHGVRAGLLHGEHGLLHEPVAHAVLVQVVPQPVAGAQQPHGVGRQTEGEPGGRAAGRRRLLRQTVPLRVGPCGPSQGTSCTAG